MPEVLNINPTEPENFNISPELVITIYDCETNDIISEVYRERAA